MQGIKRVFLECTYTYQTNLNTGIQRVVRNIIRESGRICKEANVACYPVIIKHGRLWTIDGIKNRPSLRARIKIFVKNAYRKFRPFLYAVPPFSKIERFLYSAYRRLSRIALIETIFDIPLLFVLSVASFQQKIAPRKGDLLLMLDSSWVYPVWRAVKWTRKRGAKVGFVVHDIFQITHPHLFEPLMTERFRVWFEQAIDNADFLITNSLTTLEEVKKYIKSNRPLMKSEIKCESFRLGSVMDNVSRNNKLRNGLKPLFENNDKISTYLTVGTIEPRKNYNYLLDAFDEIWQQCPDIKLCIVGRIGWSGSGPERSIRSHPKYNKCLFMFNDLSDTELEYCYKHAKALIFPSIVEGFGLPLVEALHYKLPVFASDIPIFREVGRDFCTYFDLEQTDSLAKIVIDIEKKGKMPDVRNPAEYPFLDWEDSCRELVSKAVALYGEVTV